MAVFDEDFAMHWIDQLQQGHRNNQTRLLRFFTVFIKLNFQLIVVNKNQ